MLKQDHATETPPSQAHYSPEEAGEILRIAAHLQDNTITAEQLRAIAREAGVSDENLERAIQQYEQIRQAEAQMRQRATAQRKRRYKVFALFSAVIVVLFALARSPQRRRYARGVIRRTTCIHPSTTACFTALAPARPAPRTTTSA
jgi:hypothetical protein